MLYYAVKSVDNKPVNKIYDDWDQCKIVVWGKKAVYKSFTDRNYAEKFIVNAPVRKEEFGHGYVPQNADSNIIFGKYLFDRFPTQADGYGVRRLRKVVIDLENENTDLKQKIEELEHRETE